MPVFETLQQAIDRVQDLGGSANYTDRQTNVFAVVLECTLPRTTRGTDFIVNAQLVDESRYHAAADAAEQLQPVELILFCKRPELMPQVRVQPGDIILLRHAMVQFWDPPTGGPRKPQLFGKMSKPHNFGFLLYSARAPPTPTTGQQTAEGPYQSFNVSSYGTQQETQQLQQLRVFSAQLCRAGSSVPDNTTIYLRRIKDLEMPEDPNDRPECVDMRVKVLGIDKREAGQQVVLYVWDGTDAKPIPAEQQWAPAVWRNHELSLSCPARRRIMPLSSQAPNLLVQSDLPPVGSAVPVVIEPSNMPRNDLPSIGSWIKLKVVGLTAVQGQLQVVYGKDSRVNPSNPGNSFAPNYNKRMADHITSEWPLTNTNVATRCIRTDLQLLTLRQLHQVVAQQQAGPFRVRLRLVGYYPRELQQWCKLVWKPVEAAAAAAAATDAAAGPSSPQRQLQQQWEWAAHLLLEDATGDLRALLMGQHATSLLGLPPHDLTQHPEDVRQLRERLEYLSIVDQDGGVWMDVALTAVFRAAAGQQQQQQTPSRQQQAGAAASAAAAGGGGETATPDQIQQEQRQHIQPAQQVVPDAAGAAAVSGGRAAAAPCVFILHDAVCLEMQNQEQQHGSQKHLSKVESHDEGPQSKKQCLGQQAGTEAGVRNEPASTAGDERELQGQQELTPESRRQKDLRHAYAFM